jgi:hypothetical protein
MAARDLLPIFFPTFPFYFFVCLFVMEEDAGDNIPPINLINNCTMGYISCEYDDFSRKLFILIIYGNIHVLKFSCCMRLTSRQNGPGTGRKATKIELYKALYDFTST